MNVKIQLMQLAIHIAIQSLKWLKDLIRTLLSRGRLLLSLAPRCCSVGVLSLKLKNTCTNNLSIGQTLSTSNNSLIDLSLSRSFWFNAKSSFQSNWKAVAAKGSRNFKLNTAIVQNISFCPELPTDHKIQNINHDKRSPCYSDFYK